MYDYEPVRLRVLQRGEEDLSQKEQGIRLGVSERYIRRVAEDGMDDYECDLLCTKGLGLHPAIVYGADAWWGVPGEEEELLALLDRLAAMADVAPPKRRRAKAS